MTGLIVIASDEPRAENRVQLASENNALGIPAALVQHHYTRRDRRARRHLICAAAAILCEAGAIVTVTKNVHTFSHALGTVRMGTDERTSPLDAQQRLRGCDNVYVTDASAFPTSAGVNPSLTVAALAYRAGCGLAGRSPAITRTHSSRLLVVSEVNRV
jgi:choline dehydrogenase-like flavoprotein